MMNPSVAAKTSPAINPDWTSGGKEHFVVLDELRSSAAFLIVIFHLFNYFFGWNTALRICHAYPPVDRFFGLSGFVVAYAYDDRWTKMSIPPIPSHPAHPAPSASACWSDVRPPGLSLRSVWKDDQPHSSTDVAACVCDLIGAVAVASTWGKAGGTSDTQRTGLVTHAGLPWKRRLCPYSSSAMTSCDVENCWIATKANVPPGSTATPGSTDLKLKNSTKSPRHLPITARP